MLLLLCIYACFVYAILLLLGIPSAPTVISIIGGVESAVVTLRVDNYGVTNASDYTVMISVYNDMISPLSVRNISTNTLNTPYISTVIDNIPSGENISLSFISVNTYGQSITGDISHNMIIRSQKCML